jgi:hypothetical protein
MAKNDKVSTLSGPFARVAAEKFPKKNGKAFNGKVSSFNKESKVKMPAGYNDMGLTCGTDEGQDYSTSNPLADD